MNAGFEVTLKDVYDAQQETTGQIGALATQLAVHTATVAERLDSGRRRFDDQEKRLRALEQFRWKAAGMAAFAGLLAGAAGSLLDYLAHH